MLKEDFPMWNVLEMKKGGRMDGLLYSSDNSLPLTYKIKSKTKKRRNFIQADCFPFFDALQHT